MACIFCEIAGGRAPASTIVETDNLLAIMDIYPFRRGHALVLPKMHAGLLSEMATPVGELFALGVSIAASMRASSLRCDDVNFLVNDGPAANQTVPHAHLHIVPRRRGDLPLVVGAMLKRPTVALWGRAEPGELDRLAAELRAGMKV